MSETQTVESSGRLGIGSIPMLYKVIASILVGAVLLISMAYLICFLINPESYPSPKELSLLSVVTTMTIILLAIWLPWDKMGFTVKKIGFLELERVLSVQADELAEELTEIRNRVAEVEKHAKGLDEISGIRQHLAEQELRPLLTVFLTKFSPKAFSPLKIKDWGSTVEGFERLRSFSQGDIRAVLQSMVSDGKASTTISRMGNTLYRARN